MMAESGTYTPETIARRLKMAEALLAEPQQPIQHWTQGLNELFKGAIGGRMMAQAEREQREGETAANKARLELLGLGGPQAVAGALNAPAGAPAAPAADAPPRPPVEQPAMAMADGKPVIGPDGGIMPPPRQGGDIYSKAIASNESGGRYDAQGPVIPKTGDRAYGKYQVMGENVGPWTKQYYGMEMTPQQFLANPEAQEAVFRGKFGEYVNKYGPNGAARAWFAGEGGMNDPNRKDVLGTSVAEYGRKFDAALPTNQVAGPGAPSGLPPVAAAPGAPSGAAPPAAPAAGGAVPAVAAALTTPAAPVARPDVGDAKAKIAAMLNSPNPYVRRQGAMMADAIVQKQMADTFAAPKYEFKTAGDTLYRTSERTGTAEPVKDVGRQVRPMTAAERTQWNVPEGLSAGVDANGKPVFSPAGVNVNVGGGSDKQIFDVMDKSAESARTTAAGLVGLREARQAIQGGAITGAGANQVLGLQKVASLFGVGNTDKIVNTETFRSAIAPQVAAVLKSTVGTANISNTDREFAEKAAGGNITLDEKSITRLLDIMERASVNQLKDHQKRLDKVYPPDVEKHRRERALFGVDVPEVPAAPAPAVTPAVPAGGPSIVSPAAAATPERKTIGGKNYVKRDGQWFEE